MTDRNGEIVATATSVITGTIEIPVDHPHAANFSPETTLWLERKDGEELRTFSGVPIRLSSDGRAWIADVSLAASQTCAPIASGKKPLVQITRRDGQAPCGECHIQPAETCDICGAMRPDQTAAEAAASLAQLAALMGELDQPRRLAMMAEALGLISADQAVSTSAANRMGDILGFDGRTVLRWCLGARVVPPGAWRDMAEAMASRAQAIVVMAQAISGL